MWISLPPSKPAGVFTRHFTSTWKGSAASEPRGRKYHSSFRATRPPLAACRARSRSEKPFSSSALRAAGSAAADLL
jgi:hypothetical protein